MRSGAVKIVQQGLRVSPASGFFGARTVAAVKRFQSAHGLPMVGVVGPRTWAALRAVATGNVTGPHLHFEVHRAGGGPVNPQRWLTARGVRL